MPAPGTIRRSVLRPSLLLALALVLAKSVHLGLPSSLAVLPRWILDLAIITHADLLYVLCTAIGFQLALSLTARRPRLHRFAWIAMLAFGTLSVLYGVLSAQVFWFLRMPLTYPLLYMAGDVRNMQSSIGAFATPTLVTLLIASPAVYLLLVLVPCPSLKRVIPNAARNLALKVGGFVSPRVMQCAAVLILLAYLWAAHGAAGVWSLSRDDRRIAENPHYILLASCVAEFFGPSSLHLDESFPDDALNDFRTVAQLPTHAAPTANLPRGPRNVILIVMESVSTQHMGLYGSPWKTTPCLDREARHALVFDAYYAHFTNTANALSSMLLSVYPPLTWREVTVENPAHPGDTIPQILKPLGYRTAFISAGDNQYANQFAFLQNRGFDLIQDCRDTGRERDFSWGVEDRHMVDLLLQWIDQDPSKPFFAFTWTQSTHNPYLPGPNPIDFFKESGVAPPNGPQTGFSLLRFLNALHESDRQIGRLLDELRRRNLADDTLVIITGDHGEAFGYPHNTWGHTGKTYEEDLHVPLMIWNPKLFHRQRSGAIGGQVDLSPTILDLLNVHLPPSWQGRSLFSPNHSRRVYTYGAMDTLLLTVRERDYKYTYNATLGREELYNLSADPDEQTNLADKEAELCRRLRQRLAAWVSYPKRQGIR